MKSKWLSFDYVANGVLLAGFLVVVCFVLKKYALPPLDYTRLATPTNPGEFWGLITGVATVALFVGTVALAVVAYRGLRSLSLTKRDIDTRNKREARALAIARCEEFARTIIPMNAPLLGAMKRASTPVFVKAASEVKFDGVQPDELERAAAWCSALPPEVIQTAHHLLNALEAWSMYFTAQLADSDIAYEPVGAIFCAMVIQYYAMILLLRASSGSGNYSNMVMLYKGWMAVGTEKERAVRYKLLLDQVAEVQRGGTAGERLAQPLGYDT